MHIFLLPNSALLWRRSASVGLESRQWRVCWRSRFRGGFQTRSYIRFLLRLPSASSLSFTLCSVSWHPKLSLWSAPKKRRLLLPCRWRFFTSSFGGPFNFSIGRVREPCEYLGYTRPAATRRSTPKKSYVN